MRELGGPWTGKREKSEDDGPATPSADTRVVVSLNLLCHVGAVLGLVSLFLPWIWTTAGTSTVEMSGTDILASSDFDFISGKICRAVVVFMIGSVFAIIAPLGGAVQAAGLAMFYSEEILREEGIAASHFAQAGVSVGFLVAVLSTAIVMAGLALPMGPGYGPSQEWWSSRAFTFGRTAIWRGSIVRLRWARPSDIAKMAHHANPRTAVALVVVIALVSITFAAAAFHEDDPVAERIRGGVVLSMKREGGVFYHVPSLGEWYNTRLSIHDGTDEIEWIPPPDGWGQGVWTAFSFEPAEFGDLDIRLTIVDLSGDGYANLGDSLILEPVNGTAFELATEYTMEVYYPRIIYATDIGSVTTAVVFSLTDDGVLDSESSTTFHSPWGGGHTLDFQTMTVVAVYLTTIIVVPTTLYYALVDKMVRRAMMRRIITEDRE